jgi:hypothetical protein
MRPNRILVIWPAQLAMTRHNIGVSRCAPWLLIPDQSLAALPVPSTTNLVSRQGANLTQKLGRRICHCSSDFRYSMISLTSCASNLNSGLPG